MVSKRPARAEGGTAAAVKVAAPTACMHHAVIVIKYLSGLMRVVLVFERNLLNKCTVSINCSAN